MSISGLAAAQCAAVMASQTDCRPMIAVRIPEAARVLVRQLTCTGQVVTLT